MIIRMNINDGPKTLGAIWIHSSQEEATEEKNLNYWRERGTINEKKSYKLRERRQGKLARWEINESNYKNASLEVHMYSHSPSSWSVDIK